jgi:hypothetical protein
MEGLQHIGRLILRVSLVGAHPVVEHRVVGGTKNAVLWVGRAIDTPWCKGAVERTCKELSGDATTLSQDLHDTGGQ